MAFAPLVYGVFAVLGSVRKAELPAHEKTLKFRPLKKETHAARWGLLRGYSGKATKWVDFVMTDSTRRESCHLLKVLVKPTGVKSHLWIAFYLQNASQTTV
jgi:hypothetical protein